MCKRLERKRCNLSKEEIKYLHFTVMLRRDNVSKEARISYNCCLLRFIIYDKREDNERKGLPKVYCGICLVSRDGDIIVPKMIFKDVQVKKRLYNEIKKKAGQLFELFDEGVLNCLLY